MLKHLKSVHPYYKIKMTIETNTAELIFELMSCSKKVHRNPS